MKTRGRIRRASAVCVLTGMSSGLVYLPACSLTDIGENIISGSLSFVEGYTEEILSSLFPPPEEVLGGAEG